MQFTLSVSGVFSHDFLTSCGDKPWAIKGHNVFDIRMSVQDYTYIISLYALVVGGVVIVIVSFVRQIQWSILL